MLDVMECIAIGRWVTRCRLRHDVNHMKINNTDEIHNGVELIGPTTSLFARIKVRSTRAVGCARFMAKNPAKA